MRISENEELKGIFQYLADNKSEMSLSQITLIKGFKKYFKRNKKLSDKQLNVLLEIKKNLIGYKQKVCNQILLS